jgi:hypothetical protein
MLFFLKKIGVFDASPLRRLIGHYHTINPRNPAASAGNLIASSARGILAHRAPRAAGALPGISEAAAMASRAVRELQADDAPAQWLKKWETAVRIMKDLSLRLRISPQSRQLRELQSLDRQTVHVRRCVVALAVATHVGIAEVIRQDENDVRLSCLVQSCCDLNLRAPMSLLRSPERNVGGSARSDCWACSPSHDVRIFSTALR